MAERHPPLEALDARLLAAVLAGCGVGQAALYAGVSYRTAHARLLGVARVTAAALGRGLVERGLYAARGPQPIALEPPPPSPVPLPPKRVSLKQRPRPPVAPPPAPALMAPPPPIPAAPARVPEPRPAPPARIVAPRPALPPRVVEATTPPAPKGGGARGLELIRAAMAKRAAEAAVGTCSAPVLIAGRAPQPCGRPVPEGQHRCSLHLPHLARSGDDRRLGRLAVRFEAPPAPDPENPDVVGIDGRRA